MYSENIIQGLYILMPYTSKENDVSIEDDILYGPLVDMNKMTDDEIELLEENNWTGYYMPEYQFRWRFSL